MRTPGWLGGGTERNMPPRRNRDNRGRERRPTNWRTWRPRRILPMGIVSPLGSRSEGHMSHPSGATVAPPMRKPADDELDVYGLTHPGKVRKTNQDHFLICSLRKQMLVHLTSLPNLEQLPVLAERLAFLAVVADGVGG